MVTRSRVGPAGVTARSGVGLVAAVLLLAAVASRAHAAEPASGADAVILDAAKADFLRGQALYADGNYRAALDAFLKSRELMPDAATAYNVALCHEHLGQIEHAIAAYKEYLRLGGEVADAPAIRETITRLDRELTTRSGGRGVDLGHMERPFLGNPRWWAVVTVASVLAASVAFAAFDLWRQGRLRTEAFVQPWSSALWSF